jgi:mannose-6-phosphate isomerase-like protein (cupin superfamily)
MQNFHITLTDAITELQKETMQKFTVLMQHGTMSVEYFAPDKIDTQTPHKQDELYVIASGSGTFLRDGEHVQYNKGDILFVPAGMEHRFENFTEDFATWVIFYGKEGGEK